MTNKKEPEALRLADELEDSLESHDGSSLTARCQGIADDAAAELRRLHAENETLRAGYAAARLEIESLRGQQNKDTPMTNPTPHGQVPAIQRYKIGYHADEWGQRSSTPSGIPDASGSWVRYEDHVTALKAAQPVVTPQPGAAYAALPDGVATLCEYGGDVFTAAQMRAFADATCALRAESLAAAYREELDKLSQRNYELRLASHGQAPAQPSTVHCKGRNCAAVDGRGHSAECISDHDRTTSELNTSGNRHPAARYAGYSGAPCPTGFTEDELAAWREGAAARITPPPQTAQPAPVETMALQEVWDAAGGNRGITPTRDDVLLALKTLDEVCDEAPAQAAPAAVAGPWSLGEVEEGSWRDIDHKDHWGVIRIVWKMEGDERTPDCEARALAVVDALNAAAHTTQPAPGEQNESAYQRGYMDGMAKGRRDVEAAPQQEAQGSCATCAALARTVMLDQASFDRKPNCYAIRQITDDEGVEEWEDIRTSPDVAREEANYMMATGRGEIYEVVPLWTTPQPEPQPSPAAQGDALDAARLDWLTFNLSGKALRDIGVVWSEHGDARRAIDAARAAQEGK